MAIFTIHGTTIEVAKGGQSATARRPEVRDDKGQIIQSAAAKDFVVIREIDAPTPEVQATRWSMSLPAIIEAKSAPAEKPKDKK